MSEREISPEARMVVLAAFSFAGVMGANEGQWRTRFNEGVLRAAAAMNGKAAWDAQDMLDADIFTGEYGGYDFEESSKRLIVKIKSDTGRTKSKDDDGFERIRTERTDSPLGYRMQHRLDNLSIGSRIVAWKVLEKMANSDDDQKVRVMKHFEVLRYNRDAASSGTAQPTPPPAAGETPSSPAAQTDVDRTAQEAIVERVNALDNPQKIAFVKFCRENHLSWAAPPSDQVDKIMAALGKVEKNESP